MISDGNRTRTASTLIEPSCAGKRLDVYLAERFTYHSRNEWQNHIRDGRILLNGGRARSSRRLQAGECVEFLASDIEEPPVDSSHGIVYTDDHIIVVSKSGNLPCHPAGPFFKNTLWHMLVEKYGKVYFVNRIDRETSGLVLLARTPEIASAVSERHCEILKKYVAIVHGEFPPEYHAKGFLMPDMESEVRKKRRFVETEAPVTAESEYAETRFRLLSSGQGMSAVEAELVTGRLHQIRATLCSLGFPLVGDKIYGLDEGIYLRFARDEMTKADREALVLDRQALHAAELRIRHPVTGENHEFKAEIPADMAEFIGKFSQQTVDM